MKPLEEIYSSRFFRHRHKLHWRAPYVCSGINKVIEFTSVVDVGCATGDLVNEFSTMGKMSYGIEGSADARDYVVTDGIFYLDLRIKDVTRIGGCFKVDLCTCFEVAEHIEPEYADIFVDNLAYLAPQILVSAAPLGQGGHYHVNCQPYEYWIQKFSERGYYHSPTIVDQIKKMWEPWRKKDGIRAFYNNLLFFTKKATNEA